MKSLTRIAPSCLRAPVCSALLILGLSACGDDGTGSVGGVATTMATTATLSGATSGMIFRPINGHNPIEPIAARPPTTTLPVIGPITDPTPPIGPGTSPKITPSISGIAPQAATVGMSYRFVPTVSVPSGTALVFSIQNKPDWAIFNASSGTLTGTPVAANVGTYRNIVLSVSDGTGSASLPAFTIAVNQTANGTATLDWTPPTQNTDGSALTNLAGYHVYYGTSASNLSQTINVSNPGLTTYTVTNLASGTWYFAVSAYSNSGTESNETGVVSTTL